jgi:hypothetical protein
MAAEIAAASALDTVLGQLTSGFSKAFLTTGVMPAATLLVGARLYAGGVRQLETDLSRLFESIEAFGVRGILFIILLLAVAGLFYLGRSVMQRQFQTVDAFGLHWLQRWLLRKQRRRWQAYVRALLTQGARFTPVRNALAGKVLTGQGDEWNTPEQIAQALEDSKRGREVCSRKSLFEDVAVDAEEANTVVKGLVALSRVPVDKGAAEVDAWKLLADYTKSRRILKIVDAELWWEFRHEASAHQQMPSDQQWLAPTKLGNRVAALDDYAAHRYKISTGTLWARLSVVLGAKETVDVGLASLAVQGAVNMATAFFLLAGFGIGSSLYSVVQWASSDHLQLSLHPRGLLIVAVSSMLAVGCYNAAVTAFDAVAEQIRRLVDVHRLKLITAVGYIAPQTVAQELAAFEELASFFDGATPRNPERTLSPKSAVKTGDDSPDSSIAFE